MPYGSAGRLETATMPCVSQKSLRPHNILMQGCNAMFKLICMYNPTKTFHCFFQYIYVCVCVYWKTTCYSINMRNYMELFTILKRNLSERNIYFVIWKFKECWEKSEVFHHISSYLKNSCIYLNLNGMQYNQILEHLLLSHKFVYFVSWVKVINTVRLLRINEWMSK